MLQADRHDTGGFGCTASRHRAAIYPAFPLRDLVPFPTATYPLFVGREKTVHALNQAFERQREIVLAIQRDPAVDEPGFEDVYEIGILAQLLELEPLDDGTLKVLVQGRRRVAIRSFAGKTGAFQAEIADVSEGPIPDAPDLIQGCCRALRDITRRPTEFSCRRFGRSSIKPVIPDGSPISSATRMNLPIRDK